MLSFRRVALVTCEGSFKIGLRLSRRFHNSKILFKKTNAEEEPQKVTPVDLSSALKHTSKLRVSNRELATLDEDIEFDAPLKINKKYTQEINDSIFSPEIQKAIKQETKSIHHPHKLKSFPKSLIEKTNSKLLEGFSRKTLDTKPSKTWIPRSLSKSTTSRSTFNRPVPKLSSKDIEVVNETISASTELEQVQKLDSSNIARLAHKLDRTLFSPGVHFLQDPRTRIYNFTPYLKKIIKLEDFNFDAIETFVSVSKDETLLKVATEHNKKFYSSTSSMTSTLIQYYLLLNNYCPGSEDRFSFPKLSGAIERFASSVIVQPKGRNEKTGETIYAVESDKSADTEILLSAMGHCLEALLTTEEKEFEKYKLSYKNEIVNHPQPQNVYNYATYGDFLMRSQLDCYDDRLPGNGTFDLKTRAVCAIRHDSGNPELENNSYQIWKLNGNLESFEREFNDLIRTGALLKYGFQARIGRMDGIFIAYHNINSFFGFEYLPLSQIDNIFYNHTNNDKYKHFQLKNLDNINDDLPSHVADTQFKMSITIWEKLLKTIIQDLNKDTAFRLVIKSQKRPNSQEQRLHAMAAPLNESQVKQLQTFPTAFKTSFKEDLTPEERLKNLSQHRDELNSFNKETSENGILSYYVDVEHLFGNSNIPTKDLHSYPRSKDQKWNLRYTITKTKDDSKRYLDLLSFSSEMIVSSFERNMNMRNPSPSDDVNEIQITDKSNIMHIYSAIGKARAKRWEEKDSNPVIYEPRS